MRPFILIVGVLSCACSDNPGADSSAGDGEPTEAPLREGLWTVTPTTATKNTCNDTNDALSIGVSVLARVVISADGTTFTLDANDDDIPASIYTLTGENTFVRSFDITESVSTDCAILNHYQFDGVIRSDVSADVTVQIAKDQKGSCFSVSGLPPMYGFS